MWLDGRHWYYGLIEYAWYAVILYLQPLRYSFPRPSLFHRFHPQFSFSLWIFCFPQDFPPLCRLLRGSLMGINNDRLQTELGLPVIIMLFWCLRLLFKWKKFSSLCFYIIYLINYLHTVENITVTAQYYTKGYEISY